MNQDTERDSGNLVRRETVKTETCVTKQNESRYTTADRPLTYSQLECRARELGLELSYRFNPDEPKLVWDVASLQRKQTLWRDQFTCQYCGEMADDLNIEHIVPLSRKSTRLSRDSAFNVTTSCAKCNSSKGRHTPAEWRAIMHAKNDDDPEKYAINPWIGLVAETSSGITGVVTSLLGSIAYIVEYPSEVHHRVHLSELTITGICDDLFEVKQELPIPLQHIDVRKQCRHEWPSLMASVPHPQSKDDMVLCWEIQINGISRIYLDGEAREIIERYLDYPVSQFLVTRRRMTRAEYDAEFGDEDEDNTTREDR